MSAIKLIGGEVTVVFADPGSTTPWPVVIHAPNKEHVVLNEEEARELAFLILRRYPLEALARL